MRCPTPSCHSERYFYHLVTWRENMGIADDAHDTSAVTLITQTAVALWSCNSNESDGRSFRIFYSEWRNEDGYMNRNLTITANSKIVNVRIWINLSSARLRFSLYTQTLTCPRISSMMWKQVCAMVAVST